MLTVKPTNKRAIPCLNKESSYDCVYKITNTVNGKFYVGCSNNIERRFMEHKTPGNVQNGTHVLARAFRKYGVENFSLEVLEKCSRSKLAEREAFYVSALNPEYNMTDGGLGNPGRVVTPEQRKRLSKAAKMQWNGLSNEEKERIISRI